MTMYKACKEFKILPWEFRELDEWKQGELMGLVVPEIQYELEQTAKRDKEKAERERGER